MSGSTHNAGFNSPSTKNPISIAWYSTNLAFADIFGRNTSMSNYTKKSCDYWTLKNPKIDLVRVSNSIDIQSLNKPKLLAEGVARKIFRVGDEGERKINFQRGYNTRAKNWYILNQNILFVLSDVHETAPQARKIEKFGFFALKTHTFFKISDPFSQKRTPKWNEMS